MSRLDSVAAFCAGAALSALVMAAIILTAPAPSATAVPADTPVTVCDKPGQRRVPLYTQTDERWGGLAYAGADIATSGCGLTCASMAWEYLSGRECTPAMLLSLVGDDFVQAGQNYMPGFCAWMREQDQTLDYTVIYEDRERALAEAADGRMVFGSMEGALVEGGREYGGHVVLLTGYGGGKVTVHDPCAVYELSLTEPQFNDVDWGYFISIGRE